MALTVHPPSHQCHHIIVNGQEKPNEPSFFSRLRVFIFSPLPLYSFLFLYYNNFYYFKISLKYSEKIIDFIELRDYNK